MGSASSRGSANSSSAIFCKTQIEGNTGVEPADQGAEQQRHMLQRQNWRQLPSCFLQKNSHKAAAAESVYCPQCSAPLPQPHPRRQLLAWLSRRPASLSCAAVSCCAHSDSVRMRSICGNKERGA